MSDLFLPPPFDSADVLRAILGGERLPEGRAATLPAHGLRRDPGGVAVALAATDGETTPGRLLAASGAARDRLDFAMAALGAAPVEVAVETGEERQSAAAYLFAAEPPTGQGVPAGEDYARLVEALREIMGHYGRRAPAAMPALLHGIVGPRARPRAGRRAPRFPSSSARRAPPATSRRSSATMPTPTISGSRSTASATGASTAAMSDVLGRGVFTSGDAVTVLPYDPQRDSVLLIEQFRAGPYARRDPRPWCLETVAGRCDRAEPPEATARREAREEAGLTLGRLERIAAYYPSPGIMSEYITGLRRRGRSLGGAAAVHGLAEEHEDIRALVVPRAEALAAAARRRGQQRAAPALALLARPPRRAAARRVAVIRPSRPVSRRAGTADGRSLSR